MEPPPRILVPPAGQLPQPNGIGTQTVPQQRPNISYFLFLSLMFYLLNSNNSATSSTNLFNPPLRNHSSIDSNSTTSPYLQARHRLLLREARYEGLSRWLGASNTSTINEEGWLNSTHFPQATNNASSAIKVTPFEPQDPLEPRIVVEEVLQGIMDRENELDWRNEESKVYPMNLTGFVKGQWQAKDYTWSQLEINETWSYETRRRRIVKEIEESNNSTTLNDTSSTVLARRQTPSTPSLDNSTLPSISVNSTLSPSPSNATYETILTTYNRTLLRGSFPFTHHPRQYPNKALFNLREVQTSATGPIVALPSEREGEEKDDSKLLVMREDNKENPWQEWEKKGPVTYLGGDLTLSVEEGENAGVLTNLDVEAAHLISSGLLYGYATPSFIRSHLVETVSLPFFSNRTSPLSLESSNLTAQAIGRSTLKEVGRRLQNDVDNLDQTVAEREANEPSSGASEEEDAIDSSIPQCIFRFYGSLSPLPPVYTRSLYSEFYASLFRPTGSSLPPPPPQTLHYVLSSTNCGLVLTGKGSFLPTPLLWTRTKDFALLIGFAQLVLVVGLVRHLEKVATRPGTVMNVASAAIGVGCIVDAYVFVLLLTAGVVTSSTRSSLPLFLPSFLALLSSLLFGMRYVSMIRAATPLPTHTPTPRPTPPPQPPVPATPSREELAANAAERRARGEEVSTEEEGVEVPLLPPAPVPVTGGNGWDIVPRSEKVILALMLSALFGSIAIIFRWGWIPLIILIVYSYWIPQIILNVQRGTARQSLSNEFVVSTTVARLVLPVYFYGYSDNVLDVDVSPWIYVLILYSSFQALVLVLQSRSSLGARFFLSQRTLDVLDLPQIHTWDYHQPLSESKLLDIEVSLREEGKTDEIGPDCPICMDNVAVRPTKEEVEANGSVIAGERVRQAYALTPCGHLVHTECLQEWMNVRAICPVCRAGLPSLS